ncbi:restriction endonuclease subunit S [Algoriphagus marinus]|uniref:restriction endonuclease subunit S n=1 Tax=Algoriphagus marinus TaxID=1925762 RepID=UPI00094BB643|nr:restriction endonuclease subunit S [Algoriphagus marinus]
MISEKRNVPKLRFEGLTTPWKRISLGNISRLITKGTTPKQFIEGDVVYVKIESLNGHVIERRQCASIDESTHLKELKRSILEEDDILFAIAGATVGKIGVVQKEILPANTNQALAIIRLSNKEAVNFIFQILTSRVMKNYIYESVSVGAQPNLSLKQISDFTFFVPSLPEQQKIAEFLTAVDKRIALLEQKKEKLESYKKGVMQQLFPSTGSGQVPKIRFKQDDGSEFPDWEEKKLGEIYEFRTTNSFSREKLNYESGEFRNIHYGDIHTKFPTLLDLEQVNLPFVNDDVEIRKTVSENLVEAGDLVIADASEDYADIGKTIEVINVKEQRVLSGLHTLHAKRSQTNIQVGFGGYLMKSEGIRSQVKKIAQGTKVLSISVARMRELSLSLPCLEEQKKIVQFLTGLDRNMENLNQQINQTQTWKKGLLQKMFV